MKRNTISQDTASNSGLDFHIKQPQTFYFDWKALWILICLFTGDNLIFGKAKRGRNKDQRKENKKRRKRDNMLPGKSLPASNSPMTHFISP